MPRAQAIFVVLLSLTCLASGFRKKDTGAGARGAASHVSAGRKKTSSKADGGILDEDESETAMPRSVSKTIREAKRAAKNAKDLAEELADMHKQQKEQSEIANGLAKETELKKADIAKVAKEAERTAAQAKAAAAQTAAAKVNSNKEWREATAAADKAEAEHDSAIENYRAVDARVSAEIEKLKAELKAAAEAVEKTGPEMIKRQNERDSCRMAYESAQEVDDEAIKELGLQTAAHRKAQEEMGKAIEVAADANRKAQTAQLELEAARAQYLQSTEDLGKKSLLVDLLWKLYKQINDFYDGADQLLENSMHSDCDLKAHECLVSPDGGLADLKKYFQSYNDMILSFVEVHESFPEWLEKIAPAKKEVAENAQEQILASCDPDMELQDAAHANLKAEEFFNAKCGEGLWEAAGLTRNKFI